MSDSSGWAAAVISFAVGCVGVAQWWTARSKVRLDLFDRRWAVYQAVRNVLGEIVRHAQVSPEEEQKYLVGIQGARFLFDGQISHYLTKEVWRKIVVLSAARDELSSTAATASRGGAAQAKADVLNWANEQYDLIDAMFGEFMHINEGFFEWLWRRHGPRP